MSDLPEVRLTLQLTYRGAGTALADDTLINSPPRPNSIESSVTRPARVPERRFMGVRKSAPRFNIATSRTVLVCAGT